VLLKDPKLAYDDLAKKSRPHIIVLPAAPVEPKVEKPAAKVEELVVKPAEATPKKAVEAAPKAEAPKAKKAKKPKAANNDDPS